MSEVANYTSAEREDSREKEFAGAILNRIQSIIESDPSGGSYNIQDLTSMTPIDPMLSEERLILIKTAMDTVTNTYNATAKNTPEGHLIPLLDDAECFVLIKTVDEDNESFEYFILATVITSDGGKSRLATIIFQDDAVRQSYTLFLDRTNRLISNSYIGPIYDKQVGEVASIATDFERGLMAAIMRGAISDQNIDYALDIMRGVAAQRLFPYEAEEFVEQLRDRHTSAHVMSGFHDDIQSSHLSEYELEDLLNQLNDRSSS